jgi:hypothetical protein
MEPVPAFAMLRQTQHLETLDISLRLPSTFEAASFGTVHLPHLHTMRVKFASIGLPVSNPEGAQGQMSAVFSKMICPSLKSLSIYDASYAGPCVSHPFNNSGIPLHALETLQLRMHMEPKALAGCLSLVPGLLSFRLHDTGSAEGGHPCEDTPSIFRDSHLSDLTASQSNPTPLCPRLQDLRILNYLHSTDTSITSAALLSFATARANTLKSCDIFFKHDPRSFVEDDLVKLRGLKETGLKIRVHFGMPYPGQEDSPTAGLYFRGTCTFMSPPGQDLSDMEGPYGTIFVV